ncbi:MAG: amidohydrolase family protein [Planctomycetes bacterium]|nr:amidohydrolase family protein [Planctomycetota bacterium]
MKIAPFLTTIVTFTAGGSALGQSRQIPAPPQMRPAIIFRATLHPITAPSIERGWVVFEGGRITDLGSGDPPDVPGAERFRAQGLHVYPGLIGTDTTLGLVETQSVRVTVDYTEFGRITPETRAVVAINPDSDLIPVARANGILTAMVMPRGGLVAGRSSTIRLDGWTWADMSIDPEAGLVIDWPRTDPPSRWRRRSQSEEEQKKKLKEDLEAIEHLFDDAEAYFRSRRSNPNQAADLRYEAMRDAISGNKPVFVRASARGQIESAVAWAVRRGLLIVIVGGEEAAEVIPLLRRHDVAVIVGGVHRLPRRRDDPYDSRYTLPATLHEAGIRFAIASGSSAAHERTLSHNAATAVAFGLPKERALEALTISAARIIGLGTTHGSIEVGKAATMIVTTGDPLQITTDTLLAFVDGRRIDLGNRHKSLYEKYREKYRQLGIITD